MTLEEEHREKIRKDLPENIKKCLEEIDERIRWLEKNSEIKK